MPNPDFIRLITDHLKREDESLTARELARRLLNERAVTDITLESLIERLTLALQMESQTRGEVARIIKRGERYTLADTGTYPIIPEKKEQESITSRGPTEKVALEDLGEKRTAELSLHVRNYPLLRQVIALLNLSHGERHNLIESLRRGVRRALKQEEVDSSEQEGPALTTEAWIRAHLIGGSGSFAKRLWEGSGKLIAPSDFESCWALIEHYQLMNVQEDGLSRVNDRGLALMNHGHDSKTPARYDDVLRLIDQREGILSLLMICLESTQLDQEELLKRWSAGLRRLGKRRHSPWLLMALQTRLNHLNDRGLMIQERQLWRLTEEGLSWLRNGGVQAPSADQEALEDVWGSLKRQKEVARESIASLLDSMNPHHFETLICELLECMGYDEIHLTPSQHDMGVDVVANIELGITSVREVIQVKRQHRSIHRPILDALRGSLHRFEAVRGTLITTSTFSKGTREAAFERGAAPVTLIDGPRLIDLLMKHEIGVQPIHLKLWRVDPGIFENGSQRDWPRWTF